jgi:hypothetical protein
MAIQQNVAKATVAQASGGSYLSMLTDHVIADVMQQQYYYDTVIGEVTTSQYNKYFDCLDTEITVVRQPRGQNSRYCADDTDLQRSEGFDLTSTTMRIGKARYIGRKLEIFQQQNCKVADLIKQVLENDLNSLNTDIEREVFAGMVLGASPFNKGLNAGRYSRVYNLGAGGMPVSITPQNVLEVLSYVVGVLSQQGGRTNLGTPFLIVPFEFETVLLNNNILANAYASGLGKSSLVTGSVPSLMLGTVKVYFSQNVWRHNEVGGRTAYSMPFGYTDATAFFIKEIENRLITQDPNSFKHYWDRLYAYDYKVMDERLLGVLYGTVNF